MKPKKFRVYFDQVNRIVLEVTAPDAATAQEKAERRWKREYGTNYASEIVEAEEV